MCNPFVVKFVILVCLGCIAILLNHGTKREVLQMNNCTQQALALDIDAIKLLVFADIHKRQALFDESVANLAGGYAYEDYNMSAADEANATELDTEAEQLRENATELEHEAQEDRDQARQDALLINETVARARSESNGTVPIDGTDQVEVHNCGWLRVFCQIMGQATDVHDQADTDFKIANEDYKKAVEAEEDRVKKLKEASSLESKADAEIREADHLSDEAKQLHKLASNEMAIGVYEWAKARQELWLAQQETAIASKENQTAIEDVNESIKFLREALDHSKRAFFYATFAMLIAGTVLAAAFLRSLPKLEATCGRLKTIADGVSDFSNQRVLSSWLTHALIFLFALGFSQVDDTDKMTIVTKGWMAGRIALQVALMESTLLQALPHYWSIRDASGNPSRLKPVLQNWVARFMFLFAHTVLEFIGVWVLFGGPICKWVLPLASAFEFRLTLILVIGAHILLFEVWPSLAFGSSAGTSVSAAVATSSENTIVFVSDCDTSVAVSAISDDLTRFSVGRYGASQTAADKAPPSTTQGDVQQAVLVEDDMSTPLRFVVCSYVEKTRLIIKAEVVVLAILIAIVVNNVIVWWQFYELQDWWAPVVYFSFVTILIMLFIRFQSGSNSDDLSTLPAVIPHPWNVKGTYELVADI